MVAGFSGPSGMDGKQRGVRRDEVMGPPVSDLKRVMREKERVDMKVEFGLVYWTLTKCREKILSK
jgi:hypothetical protein